MKSLVLLPCMKVSQEWAHGGTKSPRQAEDLEWFGCVWQMELLVWICLDCRSQSSVCRAVFFSSATAPWRISAILSWDTSHGTKVTDVREIQAGTSWGHSSPARIPQWRGGAGMAQHHPCQRHARELLALLQPCKHNTLVL